MDEKILIIDDEIGLLDMLEVVLRKEGFKNVRRATTGRDAMDEASCFFPDIILLDVMLPDIEGFQVCIQLRKVTLAPILFLSARSTDLDKLMGLGIGGDDYITKPFNPLEVVARVKAHLRRQQLTKTGISGYSPNVYSFQDAFVLNKETGELIVGGKLIECPAKEFELLAYLCENPNRIFSAQQLYERVWGEMSLGDPNTVMVHILRLRKKIEKDYKHPQMLVNIRGLGYKFLPPKQGS